MSDFSVRSDNVDVEQIMRQIRARIREKRGVDYTEEEMRELANVRLEKFLDPKGVRSGLLEEYRRLGSAEAPPPNFSFGEDTLYETHRAPIRWLRALLRPFLKLLFNPNPLVQALHIQAELNTRNAERHARLDALHYEVIHNLVVELTRTGVEVKSLKMRLESMASRLDFDERRARALEGVVQYRAGAVPPLQPPTGQQQGQRDQRQPQGRPDQSRRDQHPQDQGRRDQGPRDQGPRPPVAGSPLATPTAPGSPVEANALDADGNERRARRRRRRGRRRPGDRFGGEGGSQAFAGDRSGAGFGGASPGGAADRSTAGVGGASPAGAEDRAATIADRGSSNLGPRTSNLEGNGAAPVPPAPSSEPPSES